MQRKTFLEYLRHREQKRRVFVESDDSVKRSNLLAHRFVLVEAVGNALKDLKIPHAIIGGHAVTFHGRPRMTDDIDILVMSQDVESAVKQLNLQQVSSLRTGGLSGISPDGLHIDIVAPQQPWVKEAVLTATPTAYGPMISPSFLVISKLWDSRGSQDETDVLGILQKMSDVDLDKTRKLVKKYLPNDVDDLESLISMRNY